MKDVYTGQPITGAGVTSQTFGEITILPVYKDYDSKLNGTAVPYKLEKTKYYSDLVKQGKIEYVATVTGNQGFTVPLNRLSGVALLAESDKDKGYVSKMINNAKKKTSELNSGLMKQAPSKTGAPFVNKANQQQQQTGGSGTAKKTRQQIADENLSDF
jgi:hypothetical protein